MADDPLDVLGLSAVPPARPAARQAALDAAAAAFLAAHALPGAQGSARDERLTSRAIRLWRDAMQRKLISAPAAALIVLPIAAATALVLVDRPPAALPPLASGPVERSQDGSPPPVAVAKAERQDQGRQKAGEPSLPAPPLERATSLAKPAELAAAPAVVETRAVAEAVAPADDFRLPPASPGDRLAAFDDNPVKSVREDPVSTFSADVDTASYSIVRRALKEGVMPAPESVRVEELINYFPYDWKGPDDAATPFNTTVTVMPTPWNPATNLLHVAIKGYDLKPATKPHANLVFLLDVSGSMDEPDKLPLLKAAFRMLVERLSPEDTVSIVTYAGNAGTVLQPTPAAQRSKILAAIDTLQPGGSTAGEAGIREAYRLAESSFVAGGVNRVMLATDGDFNVGQTDDADLKRLIEEERKSGVFLSVFGFGQGNLNDQMMQTIAQNGNGTAAYIDTLAEAEKVLVEEASSTLFPIAKDVKIQIEFNPAQVAEYRLIGYETRALARQDFNNDQVDAGEIGSGHAVTALYEITPAGSPAAAIDALRYGTPAATEPSGQGASANELAFVKIRYKRPDADVSQLITTPVTDANAAVRFEDAGADQRFSVAVAAFGEKLRHADQTAAMPYQRITEIATAARGADPFGYRSEFLGLVRLAAALDGDKR